MHGCSQGGLAWLLGGAWLLREGVRGCSWGGVWLGGCVVALGGMHAWLLWGGMHGCSWGVCIVAPGGACVVAPGGACMGYDEIRRYGQ